MGTSAPRGLPLFEHEKAGAFAQQEAVARRVEWTTGALRGLVVRGQSGEQAKARQADRIDHRVEAAGKCIVNGAAADQFHGGAHRLAAGRTCRVHRCGVAADAVAAKQQRKPGGREAAAKHSWIVRAIIIEQTRGM